MLAGLLRDEHGRRLNPSHAKKGGKRYRYYCTAASTQNDEAKAAMRIPALELEKAVLNELIGFLRDEQRLLAAVPQLNAADTRGLLNRPRKALQCCRRDTRQTASERSTRWWRVS